MRFAVRVLIGAVVVIGVAAGAALWGLILVNRAGPLETDTAVVIPKGSGLEAISLALSDADRDRSAVPVRDDRQDHGR